LQAYVIAKFFFQAGRCGEDGRYPMWLFCLRPSYVGEPSTQESII